MRETKGRCFLAILTSVVFIIGAQVSGAWRIQGAIVKAAQSQSNTLSFGEGRFAIDGKVPKGFTEIEYLYLEGGSFKRGPDGKRMIAGSAEHLKGELQGKGRRTLKLKKATMEGDALTFESQVVGGISFQFSGTISSGATEDDFVLIKGRLSKWLNGKKVAEAQVTFFWVEPD